MIYASKYKYRSKYNQKITSEKNIRNKNKCRNALPKKPFKKKEKLLGKWAEVKEDKINCFVNIRNANGRLEKLFFAGKV